MSILLLMGKGVVALVAVGAFVTIMLACWHLQGYVRRTYPKFNAFMGRFVAVLIALAVLAIVLMMLGVAVETFFWR